VTLCVNRLCFSVHVTGIGIKKAHQDIIFNFFEQVGSKENQIEGTGLGLAICKQLIKLMEGKLKLHSQFGEGSHFYFSVPYTAAKILTYTATPKNITLKTTRHTEPEILIIRPPTADIDILLPLAMSGDIQSLLNILETWQNKNPDWQNFISHVRYLAETFQVSKLQAFLLEKT
jgi:hypothetical protein